jgi:hypothetical protein
MIKRILFSCAFVTFGLTLTAVSGGGQGPGGPATTDCCFVITFDRETGDPTTAKQEQPKAAWRTCYGDCPIVPVPN